jgi:hypothetical protein
MRVNGVETALCLDDYFHDFQPDLVNMPAGCAEPSSDGTRFYSQHSKGSVNYVAVGPSFDDTYDFPVSEIYDLSRGGNYTFRFSRTAVNPSACAGRPPSAGGDGMPTEFGGVVYSNEVSFFVGPKRN